MPHQRLELAVSHIQWDWSLTHPCVFQPVHHMSPMTKQEMVCGQNLQHTRACVCSRRAGHLCIVQLKGAMQIWWACCCPLVQMLVLGMLRCAARPACCVCTACCLSPLLLAFQCSIHSVPLWKASSLAPSLRRKASQTMLLQFSCSGYSCWC